MQQGNSLQAKRVIVLGGSSGIGLAVAEQAKAQTKNLGLETLDQGLNGQSVAPQRTPHQQEVTVGHVRQPAPWTSRRDTRKAGREFRGERIIDRPPCAAIQ